MSRCVGTSTGTTGAAVMSGANVFVCKDNMVELQFVNRRGETKRKVAMESKRDMLDLAHQLLAAVLLIAEREEPQ